MYKDLGIADQLFCFGLEAYNLHGVLPVYMFVKEGLPAFQIGLVIQYVDRICRTCSARLLLPRSGAFPTYSKRTAASDCECRR